MRSIEYFRQVYKYPLGEFVLFKRLSNIIKNALPENQIV